ncbi:hypothetical protein KQI63_12535 [bacterium]|nr:hypothetical protein [bacterium]
MHRIDVDDEVFEFIKSNAEPFVDTDPNKVLRRLLLGASRKENAMKARPETNRGEKPKTAVYVSKVLEKEFSGHFRVVGRRRLMLNNGRHVVYFQNFNSTVTPYWYRLEKTAITQMQEKGLESWVVLTNPAENWYFMIPLKTIVSKVESHGYHKEDLEINLAFRLDRWFWTGLDWDITEYMNRL